MADQAKRSVLLMRMGVKISRCSSWSVPSLKVRPLGNSKGTVSSTGSRRASCPTLGSKSLPDKAMSEPGGRSMLFVCMMGSWG